MADPDLWGHLRFGHDVVATRTIPHTDVYSFTSDRSWVNHEWLAEALMYGAFAAGGVTGLVVFKAVLVMAMLMVVFRSLGRFNPSAQAYAAVGVVAVAGTLWRIQTIRPQLFSLLLFAWDFSSSCRKRAAAVTRGLIAVPAIMGIWVNVHGGWLVGIGVGNVDRPCGSRAKPAVAASRHVVRGGCQRGTRHAANPYGFRMWTFLWTTVGFARPDILEWAPISAIPLGAAVPWMVSVAAAGFVVARSQQSRRPKDLILVALLAAAAFRVNRLDAFLAVAVVVLLAPEFAQLWSTPPSSERVPDPVRFRYAAMAVTFLVAVVMSVIAGPIVFAQLRCLEPAAVSTPDPDAADFIEANHLRGNLLNWFDWGEYVIWRFGPDLKVSVDGRRETVYSDRLVTSHYRFYRNESDARDFASRIRADYVWLPKGLPIVDTLRGQGWQAVFDGPLSIVFARPTDRRFERAQARRSAFAARCFPS